MSEKIDVVPGRLVAVAEVVQEVAATVQREMWDPVEFDVDDFGFFLPFLAESLNKRGGDLSRRLRVTAEDLYDDASDLRMLAHDRLRADADAADSFARLIG